MNIEDLKKKYDITDDFKEENIKIPNLEQDEFSEEKMELY